MVQTFYDFYYQLYNLQDPQDTLSSLHSVQILSYPKTSVLLVLPQMEAEVLEIPISWKELLAAITSTRLGKSPDPDILAGLQFPSDALYAHFTVLPKVNKDPGQFSGY